MIKTSSLKNNYFRCKTCKRKTDHTLSGFQDYNKRFTCKECGRVEYDGRNEN